MGKRPVPRIVGRRRIHIPIFCILYIVWCLTHGLPDEWIFWGAIAGILDLIINPIYDHTEWDWTD